jgi:hypothetical protein
MATTAPAPKTRRSIARRLAAGSLVTASIVAASIALWPASEAEKAREDGEQFGAAVASLYEADTTEEVNAALSDVQNEAQDAREHAGDAIGDQVDAQVDALDSAMNGFVGMNTTDSSWDADLYEYELDAALDDLADNAEEFRTEAPEVHEAFWSGVEDGIDENVEA